MLPLRDNLPTQGIGRVTGALMLANVVVYLLAAVHGGSLFAGPDSATIVHYAAIPYTLHHHPTDCSVAPAAQHHVACTHGAGGLSGWARVFTAMFLHASIIHLGLNMLFLWIFGSSVEARLGSLRYLALYVLAGAVATILLETITPGSTAPTVGAQSAIASALGAHFALFPRAKVVTLVALPLAFTITEVPALAVLVLWLAVQALLALSHLTNPFGGAALAAWLAPLAALAIGLALVPLLTRIRATAAAPGPSVG